VNFLFKYQRVINTRTL